MKIKSIAHNLLRNPQACYILVWRGVNVYKGLIVQYLFEIRTQTVPSPSVNQNDLVTKIKRNTYLVLLFFNSRQPFCIMHKQKNKKIYKYKNKKSNKSKNPLKLLNVMERDKSLFCTK